MEITVRGYEKSDLPEMIEIWNEIVEDGIAFPQEELLDMKSGEEFFASQTHTAVAVNSENGRVLGLYILHPNNVGRCGHIANASYAVKADRRGKHIGEAIVAHSLEKAKELGFRLMQFNAVVAANHPAIHIYEKLGFVRIGTIPEGFHMKDGHYEDIILFYHVL